MERATTYLPFVEAIVPAGVNEEFHSCETGERLAPSRSSAQGGDRFNEPLFAECVSDDSPLGKITREGEKSIGLSGILMGVRMIGKHEKFCIGIAEGLTAEKAYVEAGYSPKGAAQSASRLLRNAEIQARINALRNAMAERAIQRTALTRAYVISCLMTIVEQCMQHVPIRDKHGTHLGYVPYNPTAAIRALEFLGKELGMFKGPPERSKELKPMTIEEMKQREAEISRRLEELEQEAQTEQPRKRKGLLH